MRDKVEIIVFVIVLSFFGLGYLFFGQREFSELENHYLSLCPEFSWESFLDGDYTKKFDEYTADQILGKDVFVKMNVAMNRSCGISEINDVYFGKEDRLIQDYQKPDSVLDENLTYIRRFAEENPETDMTMLIIPNSSQIYPELLPTFARTYDQAEVIRRIRSGLGNSVAVLDATDILLEHKEEAIYYKTDHHWTTLGAYYGYTELCQGLGLTPVAREEYDILTLSDPFYGSLYSKAPAFRQEGDTLDLYYNSAGAYEVQYPSESRTADSMYDMNYAGRKDKYAIFFGGNVPLARITSNSSNTEKVLILKDSYANCLVPMLADHYSEIHMMDLRYYHEDVGDYMKENGIKTVIFIHNVDFISTDNNFLWL